MTQQQQDQLQYLYEMRDFAAYDALLAEIEAMQ
jgi:hypothetical protein